MRWHEPSRCALGFPFFTDSPPFRGAGDPSPGGPFHATRSPSWSSAPVLSPVRKRAAVWDGRGATARPLDAKWRLGVAAVFKHVMTETFSKIHLNITTTEVLCILKDDTYATLTLLRLSPLLNSLVYHPLLPACHVFLQIEKRKTMKTSL